MKTQAQIAADRATNEDILHYVRESQQMAPVGAEAVLQYLTRMRRRKVTLTDVIDRLDDLAGEGKLKATTEWEAGVGDVTYYTITPKGRDILDGVLPPEGHR